MSESYISDFSDLCCGERFQNLHGLRAADGTLIVYCDTHHAGILPDPGEPFTLITHNSDTIPRREWAARWPNIRKWYGLNSQTPDEIEPLPIGVVNSHVPRGDIGAYREAMMRCLIWRPEHSMVCWRDGTNPARAKWREALAGRKHVTVYDELKFPEYLRALCEHGACYSPPGAGPECHRTYEALALGCTPIDLDGEPIAHPNASWRYWLQRIIGKDCLPPLHIVSFSLYGTKRAYCDGMVENAKLCQSVYPGWQVRVYHDSRVPHSILNELRRLGCYLRFVGREPGHTEIFARFWRFTAAAAWDMGAVIFRDADSRVSHREAELVAEWLQLGYPVHAIHDHPHHRIFPLLAGMWGIRAGVWPRVATHAWAYPDKESHDCDQRFLRDWWSPRDQIHTLRHSSVPVQWAYRKIPHCDDDFIGMQHIIDKPEYMPRLAGMWGLAVPGQACPYCKGRGCTHCKHTGITP